MQRCGATYRHVIITGCWTVLGPARQSKRCEDEKSIRSPYRCERRPLMIQLWASAAVIANEWHLAWHLRGQAAPRTLFKSPSITSSRFVAWRASASSPPIWWRAGRHPDSKDEARDSPATASLISSANVFTAPPKRYEGWWWKKKIWWLTSCKLTSTRGWWMERGHPLVYKRCSLFMGDSIHFCVSFFFNPFQTNPTVGSVLNTGIDTLRTKEAVNSWPAASQLEAPWKVLFHLQNGTFLFLLILNIHVKSWEKTAEAINNLTTSIKNGT